jgi:riboflavin transporter FmnP
MTDMPVGLVATFIAILVVTIIFAMMHQGGSGTTEGARFGVLIGIFVVCAFVLHNYVNLNIGLKLTLMQAVAYFVQWTIIGIVIGLIYKPVATR